ncbi:MAG: C40 family peptidase [Agathobacter sp.]|nr:C40 family peptidase [Agathobacter sp.]
MKFKKVLSLVLVGAFLLATPVTNGNLDWKNWTGGTIFASTSDRDNAQNELDNLQDEMDEMEDMFAELESQMSDKAKELSDLMAEQEILENEIYTTQVAIDQAEKDLEEAKKKEREEYEAMKLRIRYMYENSTQDSIIDAILNANGIVDMLNRVEYVSQVHKSDRELMEAYKAAVEEVEIIAAELEAEMNDLVALKEVFEHQEVALEKALADLEKEAGDAQEQLANAERRARELSNYIEEQNRLIALQQQQQQQQGGNNNSNNGNTNSGPVTAGGYLNDPSYDPAFTSNISGEELVNYALQFVGNPYKWGGNSLTNGCDCSGFVNLIYKHFGFKNVPRQSQSFKYYGQPVAFANIKAGDIVVYPGHVAIYIGNGKIVEAQSTKAGITCTRSVTCSTITAIRRVL